MKDKLRVNKPKIILPSTFIILSMIFVWKLKKKYYCTNVHVRFVCSIIKKFAKFYDFILLRSFIELNTFRAFGIISKFKHFP